MSETTRPAANAAVVTPSNDVTLSGVRGLYVGGAGDVAIRFPGNNTSVVFSAVTAGTILPVQAVKVMGTGTTATNIVALL